jgi:hypothetical protein
MADAIIERLLSQHLVVVHGDSGCGKSSLVRAGVLPSLEHQTARADLDWRTCVTVPRAAPLDRLARDLADLHGLKGDEATKNELRRCLNFGEDSPTALANLLRRGATDNVCILIDQFEELLGSSRHDPLEAQLLVKFLVSLAQAPPPGLYAIITMRSEFLGRCAQYSDFAEAVNQTQYLVPRMAHADLLRAIHDPAALYGGEVSPTLAERMILQSGTDQDMLPLIQHSLMVLHDKALMRLSQPPPDPQGAIPGSAAPLWRLDDDDLSGSGGLRKLLSDHADTVARSAPADVIQRLFRALTDINADGQAIRRPQRLIDLVAACECDETLLRSIVDSFRADGTSFLTPHGSRPLQSLDYVDVSHEALIRSWESIADEQAGWLAREFQDGLVWKSLRVQAAEFRKDPSRLLSPATAKERSLWLKQHTEGWANRYGGDWVHVTFLIDASLRGALAAEARRRTLLTIAVLVAALLGSVLVLALRWNLRATQALNRANRATAASLWNRLDFPATKLSADESNAIWELALSDGRTRAAFLEELAASPNRLIRFGRRPMLILRALRLYSAADVGASVRRQLLGTFEATATTVEFGDVQALASAAAALAPGLSADEANALLDTVRMRILASTDAGYLTAMNAPVHSLAAKLTSTQARDALSATVDGIGKSVDSDQLSALGSLARAVAARLTADDSRATGRTIYALMARLAPDASPHRERAFVGDRLEVLAGIIEALPSRPESDEAQRVVRSLFSYIASSPSTHESRALVAAVMRMPVPISIQQRQAALAHVLSQLAQAKRADDILALASAIAALEVPLTGADAQRAIRPVLAAMRHADPAQLNVLTSAIGALPIELSSEQSRHAMARVSTMLGSQNPVERYVGARALPALAPRLSPDSGRASFEAVLQVIIPSPSLSGILGPSDMDPMFAQTFRNSLPALTLHLTPERASGAFLNVVQAQGSVDSPFSAETLTATAEALVERMTPERLHDALMAVVRALAQATEDHQVRGLASSGKRLATKLDTAQAQATIDTLLAAMAKTEDPNELAALASILSDLPGEPTTAQADAALAPLLGAIAGTKDPAELELVAAALRGLPVRLRADQSETALRAVLPTFAGSAPSHSDEMPELLEMADLMQRLMAKAGPDAAEAFGPWLAVISALAKPRQRALVSALGALAPQLTPEQAREAEKEVRRIFAWSLDEETSVASAEALVALLRRGPPAECARGVVEALKYPAAAGKATDILLKGLRALVGSPPTEEMNVQSTLNGLVETYPGIDATAPPECPLPPGAGLRCPQQ